MAPNADDSTGRVVAGRYTLRRELGRGGMGTVWLASDAVLGREVAVKEVAFPAYLTEQERRLLRERTLREARAAARFEHPHVTTVHDVVEEDGRPWIVMEHVPSRALSRVVKEDGPLPVHAVARIGLELLGALEAAHRAGTLHRDVKPANVLLDDSGRACLTDFGIATSLGDPALTSAGVLLGSPSYMAPERARGEEPGPAADLWSLGATLFTAVEGRAAFERGEATATLVAVVSEEPAPTRGAGPLRPVLLGLLTKDPARRMSADAARAGLEKVAAGAQDAETGAETDAETTERLEPPRPADPESLERGNFLERVDLVELSSLVASAVSAVSAVSATRAATRTPSGRAVRTAARSAVARSDGTDRRPRWRFKRRWVAIPAALVLVGTAVVVAVAVLLLWWVLGSV